jgi:hypothetical protein
LQIPTLLQVFKTVLPTFWSLFPPPPDVPVCGFTGDLCSYTNLIIIVCAGVLFCVLILSGVYSLRRW